MKILFELITTYSHNMINYHLSEKYMILEMKDYLKKKEFIHLIIILTIISFREHKQIGRR